MTSHEINRIADRVRAAAVAALQADAANVHFVNNLRASRWEATPYMESGVITFIDSTTITITVPGGEGLASLLKGRPDRPPANDRIAAKAT